MAADFIDTLRELGLAEYADSFINEGFDRWETLIEITESDLQDLNVKLGHRRRLQKAISAYQDQVRATSQPRTSRPVSLNGSLTDHPDSDRVRPGSEGGGSATVKRAKRKYRRHPKNDINAPVKPVSAYVLFSNDMRDSLKSQDLSFTDMAKIVGERWQVLPTEQREQYEKTAQAAKDQYQSAMASYKTTQNYADYQQYLARWKAKHATPAQDGKRPKIGIENGADDANGSNDESLRSHGRDHGGSVSSAGGPRDRHYHDYPHTHHHSPPSLSREQYASSSSSLNTPSLSHASSSSSQGYGSSGFGSSNPNLSYPAMSMRRSPQSAHLLAAMPPLSRDGSSHTSVSSVGPAASISSRSEDSHSPTAHGGLPNSPFNNMSLTDRTQRISGLGTPTTKVPILPPLQRYGSKGEQLPPLREITRRSSMEDPLTVLGKAADMLEGRVQYRDV